MPESKQGHQEPDTRRSWLTMTVEEKQHYMRLAAETINVLHLKSKDHSHRMIVASPLLTTPS